VFQIPVPERIELLKNPERRRELDQRARSHGPLRGLAAWENLTVHAAFEARNKHLEGRTIADIARETGKTPIDAMLDLAVSEGLLTTFMPPPVGGDESLWKTPGELWADDRTLIGASGAGAHLDMIDTFAFSTQVLGSGVRKDQVISLEQAIHKMTYVAAEAFGLKERGLLRPGLARRPGRDGPGNDGFRTGVHALRPALQRAP
jgi:N-acyl-D-aspartate/D-glutamate deacylase